MYITEKVEVFYMQVKFFYSKSPPMPVYTNLIFSLEQLYKST